MRSKYGRRRSYRRRGVYKRTSRKQALKRSYNRGVPKSFGSRGGVDLEVTIPMSIVDCVVGSVSQNSAAQGSFGSLSWSLSQLPQSSQVTAYQNTFEAWRISRIEWMMIPKTLNATDANSTGPIVSGNATVQPIFHYNNAPFPGTYTSGNLTPIMSSDTWGCGIANKVIRGSFRPVVQQAATALVTAGSTNTSYQYMPNSTWIDTDSPSTQYGSLNWMFTEASQSLPLAWQCQYQIYTKATFQFKGIS